MRLQLRRKESLEGLTEDLKDHLNQRKTEVEAFKAENEQLDTDLQILKMKFTHMYGYPPQSYGEQQITLRQPATSEWLTQL